MTCPSPKPEWNYKCSDSHLLRYTNHAMFWTFCHTKCSNLYKQIPYVEVGVSYKFRARLHHLTSVILPWVEVIKENSCEGGAGGLKWGTESTFTATMYFSCTFLANPRALVHMSIFTFASEWEMLGEQCLSIRSSPVIFPLNNVFTHECFENCSKAQYVAVY